MKRHLSIVLLGKNTLLIEQALAYLEQGYKLEKTQVSTVSALAKISLEEQSLVFWAQQAAMPLDLVVQQINGNLVFVIGDQLDLELSQAAIQLNVQEVLEKSRWPLLPVLVERFLDQQQFPSTGSEEADLLVRHANQTPGVIYQIKVTVENQIEFPFISDRIGEISIIPPNQLRKDGNIFLDYLHEEDVPQFLALGINSKATLCNWSMDFRLKAKGDTYRWMHASSNPVRLPDEAVLWYGYMEDITNEKQVQADFRDSEEQVRTLFENAPDGIVILDAKANIIRWNPKAVDIFGWESEEVIGKPLYRVIGPERNYNIYEESIARFHRGEADTFINKSLEMRACHKKGKEFPIVTSISTMYNKGELYFLCFIGDITKRKQAQNKLQQSLREKEVLLKEIHHRVKNNLQVITSLLSLQSSFINDPFISDIFKKSQYRINSMGMVHEMLYQSKDLSKIDYKEYLERLTGSLKSAMISTAQNIEVRLMLPVVYLNVDTAIPLSLIINELLTNAFKYAFVGQENGQIMVDLEILAYPAFALRLEDNGVGYSLEAAKEKTPSLGLLLVRKLAVQLEGSIERLPTQKGTAYRLLFKEITAS